MPSDMTVVTSRRRVRAGPRAGVELVSEQATARPLGRVQYWLAWIFVIGWTGVVCGGLGVQFIAWDYPCPLCLVQRMFMLLAALGGAYIVRRAMTTTVTPDDYATGWGLAIVACAAGGFASWRQTMLHILPDNPDRYQFFYDVHILG